MTGLYIDCLNTLLQSIALSVVRTLVIVPRTTLCQKILDILISDFTIAAIHAIETMKGLGDLNLV